jgi:glycolate oxidase iron-sulfur subunit
MDLGIVDDDLAACVACGLCLPHCPTYRVTGEEALSPRGRVAAMRQVQWEGAAIDDSFVRSMETCVQCRGCETACPSGVPFGRLIEPARSALAEGPPRTPATPPTQPADDTSGRPADDNTTPPSHPAGTSVGPADARPTRHPPPLALRLAVRSLRWHRLVLAGSSLLAVAQRLRLVPPRLARRLGLPERLPLRRPRLRPTPAPTAPGVAGTTDVWLFTGCVMDAWMRDVHADVQRVVEAAGGRVMLPGAGAACCGALALHAGLASEARARARRVVDAFPAAAPILVDAAGCGAMLRDYGHLLGTEDGRAFAARVLDVHEWLAGRVDRLIEHRADVPAGGDATGRRARNAGADRQLGSSVAHQPDDRGADRRANRETGNGGVDHITSRPTVAVQDPCHLRHVQRSHHAVRTLLAPFADLVELDDEGLCCGAGGAYAAVQPALAGAIRDRKLAAIARSGAPLVVSANPGCALHLAAAGVEVVHPCQVVARELRHPRP